MNRLVLASLLLVPHVALADVVIGSKDFNESTILGEIVSQYVESTGVAAEHVERLGGTAVAWAAIQEGEIDVYPDYTGTLRLELLKEEGVETDEQLAAALAERGLRMTRSLGFQNNYEIGIRNGLDNTASGSGRGTALAVTVAGGVALAVFLFLLLGGSARDGGSAKGLVVSGGLAGVLLLGGGAWLMTLTLGTANRYGQPDNEDVRAISDLRRFPNLKIGFGSEFIERADGWRPLKALYDLPQEDVVGLEHDFAYRGLASGAIDVTDVYSTDANIRVYDIRLLEDDLDFFPEYDAVLVYRADLEDRHPEVVEALTKLEGRIDVDTMTAMNASAMLDRVPASRVAASFLNDTLDTNVDPHVAGRAERLFRHTLEHLLLVATSLLVAIVVAVPIGILASKHQRTGQFLLGSVGILQTIPSLALFVALIPLFGLGPPPAIVALFLYSLLPIVRNTHAGLTDIPRGVHESAEAIGLPPLVRLWRIELPLAARSILAGIKTAAVINVGTATLGGFIGAGGYGTPIFSGIRQNRISLMLEGAIPAALMALAAQGLFELAERFLVPRGLRLKSHD